jgi:2-phospho-L-lactate guanylyltransferase
MNLWLIVPEKPFHLSKSRLAPILAMEDRVAVSRAMLTHVLSTASSTALFGGVMVVSRDRHVLRLAHDLGVVGLKEERRGLNPALEQARRAVIDRGGQSILVLPGDLPLLTEADVNTLVERAGLTPGVVIAPSRAGGTSALLMRPPAAIPFAFGRHSFARHVALAQRAGLTVSIVESSTLWADMDSPEDWRQWRAETDGSYRKSDKDS